MSALERLCAVASRWSARLGGLVILASALLVAAEVILRNLPGGPPALRLHSFELTHYGFAAAIAFGFAYALTERAHIRIDVLYALLPLPLRAALDALSLLALAGMAALMAWQAWGVTAQSARMGAMPNSTLQIPLAVPQAIWSAGLTWFALVAALLAGQGLARLLTGRVAALHAASGVAVEGMRDEA